MGSWVARIYTAEQQARLGVDEKGAFVPFRFRVTGDVQRVFFRKHTAEKAEEVGAFGWVANVRDGSVCGEVNGDAAPLAAMRRWLAHEGSPKSRIASARFTATPPSPTRVFEIRDDISECAE